MLRKPRIAYKVIGKETRYGTNWTMFTRDGANIQDRCGTLPTEDFLHKYKQYFPLYTKGSIIKKVFRTGGIMVFRSIEACKSFQSLEGIHHMTQIVKVRMIGRAKPAKKIYAWCGGSPGRIVGDLKSWEAPQEKRDPPRGSIAVDAIEVLE